MKNKKLKSSKVLLSLVVASTALASAACATAIATSRTTKDVVADEKANIYNYIFFKPGLSACTMTGHTKAAVKHGKLFSTVTDRPVATKAGYTFVCWSLSNKAAGEGSKADAFPETTAITDAKYELYPIFTPIKVESLEVIGTTNLEQNKTASYEAIAKPSYAQTKDVTWSVKNKDTSVTDALATITKDTSTGKGVLTPTKKGCGTVVVTATTTDGSALSSSLEVNIIPDTATQVTITLHTGSSAAIKVGGTSVIDATVTPAGAEQVVAWALIPDATTPGTAEIASSTDNQVTVKGVKEGKVSVYAYAKGSGVVSNALVLTISKADVEGVTINGPTRMDVKDTCQYVASITPVGALTTVKWKVYDDSTCQTESEIATIGEDTGILTIDPDVELEDGSAYVYLRATSTQTSPVVTSNVLAVRVYDIMSFMYSYTDADGDRWYYDYTTIETNDPNTSIAMYCYDNPTKTQDPIARTTFNKSITIGKYVTDIGNDFLAGCTAFNSNIVFGSTTSIGVLNTIGENFLFGCTSFNQTVSIPSTVTSIGADFMEGCLAFAQKITISENVTFVGDYFMHNCQNFQELEINTPAASFDTIWLESLDVCSVRSETAAAYNPGITVSGTTSAEFIAKYPKLEGEQSTTYKVWRNLQQGAVVTVVDGIKYTFDGTQATVHGITDAYLTPTGVTIPSKVTYESTEYTVVAIADSAFTGNTTMATITTPDTLTSIGSWAFYGCTALTTATLQGTALTDIGDLAFARCTQMTQCPLPTSVVNIGDGAFFACLALTTLELSNLTNLQTIGESAFCACKAYNETLSLPASLQSIGEEAFFYCTSLTTIVLNRFTSTCEIGEEIFTACAALNSITLSGWTEATATGWNASFPVENPILFDSIAATGTLHKAELDEDPIKALFVNWSNGSIEFDEGKWTASAE